MREVETDELSTERHAGDRETDERREQDAVDEELALTSEIADPIQSEAELEHRQDFRKPILEVGAHTDTPERRPQRHAHDASEHGRALTTLVLDLLRERQLVLSHRRVQILDAIPLGEDATKPEVARDVAEAEQWSEGSQEPADEGERQGRPVQYLRCEDESCHRADADEREPRRQLLLPLIEPDANRRGNLLRMLERQIDRLGEALGVAV